MRNPAYCLQCDDGTLLEHATRDRVFSYCGRSFSAHNVLLLTLRRCVRPPFCFLAVPVWSLAKIFSHATAQRKSGSEEDSVSLQVWWRWHYVLGFS